MAASLQASTPSPSYTKATILLALKSSVGHRTAWIVVEAEDDVNVYEKFVNPASTVVKTSENAKGRKGYANVESIVTEVKSEVPSAHICGIRDADYTRYETTAHVFPADVFVTDRRDLEMTLLESESVCKEMRAWIAVFDGALALCIPVCRYLGCLRIFNMVMNYSCVFRDKLSSAKFWDFCNHTLVVDWKDRCTTTFIGLVKGACTKEDIDKFINDKSLNAEDDYNICRGHDLLSLLSMALIDTHEYSVQRIMLKMTSAYSFGDFMSTKLYDQMKAWQEKEGIISLIA